MNQFGLVSIEQFIEENILLFLVILIWSLIWKGAALWKSAHQEDKKWFIALLLLNTFGILEIIYIYFISERNKQKDLFASAEK